MENKFWEDFLLGEKITTDSITITEAHLVNWAGLTMDFYALHMNEEYAKKTLFGQRIAHGPLTFALSIGLVGCTGIFGDSLLAWIGIENMKVSAPVMIGDTITVDAEVMKKKETKKPDRAIAIFHYTIRNQKEVCVMEYDNLFMMKRLT